MRKIFLLLSSIILLFFFASCAAETTTTTPTPNLNTNPPLSNEPVEHDEPNEPNEPIELNEPVEANDHNDPDIYTPFEYFCDCDLCEYARKRIGVTPANVKIRFLESDDWRHEWDTINEFVDINQFEDYYFFAEENSPHVTKTLFTTDSVITDFQFLVIGYCFLHDEPCCFSSIYVHEVLFSLDELTPEKPLLAHWTYAGCFTSSKGVSFVYNGTKHYFEIINSNYNSHLFLTERITIQRPENNTN